jgi:hypothetical protein
LISKCSLLPYVAPRPRKIELSLYFLPVVVITHSWPEHQMHPKG